MELGWEYVRRLEISLEFDRDNGIDALMTGCPALLLTVVVVHIVSLRPYNIYFHSGARISEALRKSSYWRNYWAGIAESGDGKK